MADVQDIKTPVRKYNTLSPLAVLLQAHREGIRRKNFAFSRHTVFTQCQAQLFRRYHGGSEFADDDTGRNVSQTAASSNDRPQSTAILNVAMAVSPAPVTSNTSRAWAGMRTGGCDG